MKAPVDVIGETGLPTIASVRFSVAMAGEKRVRSRR